MNLTSLVKDLKIKAKVFQKEGSISLSYYLQYRAIHQDKNTKR
jgi:hypothetical protein